MGRNVVKGVLAGGLPMLVYLWTASGYAHWLDSGEFVAAAAGFGISHPPGHPLASIVLGVAHLLPFGALSFRVAVLCALLGASATAALFFAIEDTLRATEAVGSRLLTPLSLGATWWVAGSQAWWFQTVRPEVYALEAFLLCLAYQRLIRLSVNQAEPDVRPLYQAALAFGLALANHHYIAIVALLPTPWLLVGVVRKTGWRPFAWASGFGAAGLLTYAFLPIRSLAEPTLNLGAPSSPARFFWTVSARAFQKSLGPERVAPFRDHLADVLGAMGEDLHLSILLVALLGGYFMLRVRQARKYGLFWLTVFAVFTVGRALLGFVSDNPDALAYFMLAYGGVAVLLAFAVGVLLSALAEAIPSRPRVAPAIAAILAVLCVGQFVRSWPAASLQSFADTDAFDDSLRRALPNGAVVLAHNPNTIFRFWGGEAEERNRPDVTLVPLPILSYPKLVEAMVDRDPELRPLLRNYLLSGALDPSELQTLAATRPVFVEMDLRVAPELYEMMVPEQLYHRVLTADMAEADEAAAMRSHEAVVEDLVGRLGSPLDSQTQVQLLWRHYTDALYFASVGDINAARRSVGAGLGLNPLAQELVAMQDALKQAAPGEPLDVTPFRAE
ncbi:MAG: DUF2723 domain-containing protein [Myxococcota bacterium]